MGCRLLGLQWKISYQFRRFLVPLRQRSDWDRLDNVGPELAYRLATNHPCDFGNCWLTRDCLLVGGGVQEVRDRHDILFPGCTRQHYRHYFLQHLERVVNNNAEQGHDPDVSEKDIRLSEYEHRSRKVAGLFKRFKSRSTPTDTPPSNWVSGVSHYFITMWTPG